MSSRNYLHIHSQAGDFTLDEQACYNELQDVCWELLQQHRSNDNIPQRMFRCINGTIQVYSGGWGENDQEETEETWSDNVNVWGYSVEWILSILCQYLKGNGLLFIVNTHEDPARKPEIYHVTQGKVVEFNA